MQLLETLNGNPDIRTIYQVGAHRAQELAAFRKMFPNLDSVAMFDPAPGVRKHLEDMEGRLQNVWFFPIAIGGMGSASHMPFHLSDNDQMSSSLLGLKEHKRLFPQVSMVETVDVPCLTLDQFVDSTVIPFPDLLFLDVQGAEYMILESLSSKLLANLKAIYTEVSTIEVYQGGRTLDEIKRLLYPIFEFVGYQPCMQGIEEHGDALFLKV